MLSIEPVEDALPKIESLEYSNRFFARQPIFDREGHLYAYELLSRSGPREKRFQGDSEAATRAMLDTFILFGADSMTGSSKAFLNCTREALVDDLASLLPPHSVVLEVLEDVEPDQAVVNACQTLKRRGYQISLDDYVPREGMESLIAIADYIKVDFRLSDAPNRRAIQQQTRGTRARLVAEKIEDDQEFQLALSEGYDLFQGYFFARPAVVSKRGLHSPGLNYLNLLAAISHTPLDWAEVERAVKACPSLTYRLLRLINSGLYLVRQEITSVKMALVMLGEQRFRKLVTVAALPVKAGGGLTNEAIMTLHRALFCELLAPRIQQPSEEQYLFGLLSLFPLLLDVSAEQLVELLPLRDSVRAALSNEHNEVSRSLEILQHYEAEDSSEPFVEASCLGVNREDVARAYLTSLHEVQSFLQIS